MKQLVTKAIHDLRQFFNKNSFYLLTLLLVCDLVFIILHLLLKFGFLAEERFDIGLDGGYGEYFQYTKLTFIILLLGYTAFRYNQKIFLGWMILFMYMLCDDVLSIHEYGGDFLVTTLNLQSMLGMRPVDIAEIMISGFFGLLFLSLIALGYSSADRTARKASVVLFVLLLGLAFCGIFIDTLHSIVYYGLGLHLWISGAFTLMEDGGEHIVISVMAVFTLATLVKYQTIAVLSSRKKIVVKNTNPVF